MDCSPAEFDVNVVCPEDQGKVPGFLVDLGSLYDYLARLEDRRDPRERTLPPGSHPGIRVLFGQTGAGEDLAARVLRNEVWHRKEVAGPSFGVAAPPGDRHTHDLHAGSWAQRCRLRRSEMEGQGICRLPKMDSWFR